MKMAAHDNEKCPSWPVCTYHLFDVGYEGCVLTPLEKLDQKGAVAVRPAVTLDVFFPTASPANSYRRQSDSKLKIKPTGHFNIISVHIYISFFLSLLSALLLV